MICDDVLVLITESPAAHGIFDTKTETKRTVFCQVRSVSQSEWWQAKSNGLHPEFVFRIADKVDYSGEKICEYNNVRYRIVRASVVISTKDDSTDGQSVDLTVERITVDAIEPTVTSSGVTG